MSLIHVLTYPMRLIQLIYHKCLFPGALANVTALATRRDNGGIEHNNGGIEHTGGTKA